MDEGMPHPSEAWYDPDCKLNKNPLNNNMSDPVKEFESLRNDSKLVFAVVYRGHWCPFCISYIRSLKAIESRIHEAGGKTVIITSEVEEHLPKLRSATGYDGPAIVDPENVLVEDLKKRNLVNVAISDMKLREYKHGMAQPAVLVIQQDGTVLYSWAIVPRLMNLQGAKDRPNLNQIWDNVEAKLNGEDPVHKTYTTAGVATVLGEKFSSK